jgi:hypothetical protein
MSLGVLVGRFGEFVSEQMPESQPPMPEEPFPADLTHIREAFGHHLVPLMLLARSDGETALSEREVVLHYCLARADEAGLNLTPAETAALSDYLRDFRPTRMQLGPALKRLEHDSKADIAALVAAAQAVVDADGERRPREMQFLDELNRDLAAL